MDGIARFSLSTLLDAGMYKAQINAAVRSRDEFCFEAGRIALLRTAQSTELRLCGIKGGRLGSVTLNKIDTGEVAAAARNVVKTSESFPQDPFLDIAAQQLPAEFNNGVSAPDRDKMYFRLSEFAADVKARYPLVKLATVSLAFNREDSRFLNSNGVDFKSTLGNYEVLAVYSSQKGEKVSSLGYSYFFAKGLDRPLLGFASCASLLAQSSEQLDARPVEGKFEGDVILAPDCAGDFFEFVLNSVKDSMICSGTSVYLNKTGSLVASEELTFLSSPVADEISTACFVTSEGYPSEEVRIIEKGILKSYLLSQYGSRKTGLPAARSDGGGCQVLPGIRGYQQLISSVKRGLLVVGFSGAKPDNNGDFSGVAKNSFYIEDGRISFPVSETMLSGNIPRMLLGIKGISKERVNFGNAVYPWIHIGGVTVSGK